MAATTSLTAKWGVTGTTTVVTGIVTDISENNEAMLEPVPNELGAIIGNVKYDHRKTLRATVIIGASVSLPTGGTAISVNGTAGYIVSAELIQNNRALQKINLTVEHYDECSAVSTPSASGSVGGAA